MSFGERDGNIRFHPAEGDVVAELRVLAGRYTEHGRFTEAEKMLSLIRSIDPLVE